MSFGGHKNISLEGKKMKNSVAVYKKAAETWDCVPWMLRWVASWGPQAPRGVTEEHDLGQSKTPATCPLTQKAGGVDSGTFKCHFILTLHSGYHSTTDLCYPSPRGRGCCTNWPCLGDALVGGAGRSCLGHVCGLQWAAEALVAVCCLPVKG